MSDIATHLKRPGVMHVSLQGLLPPFKHGRRHAQLHAADSSCSPAIFPVACNILKVGPQTLSAGLSGHCMLKKDHPRHVPGYHNVPLICDFRSQAVWIHNGCARPCRHHTRHECVLAVFCLVMGCHAKDG